MKNYSSKRLLSRLLLQLARSVCKNRRSVTLFNYLIYFFIICAFAASCKNKPKNAVEAALIEQNWRKVFDACKKDDPLLKKPETIGILGHAAIMLNKNNVSYILLTAVDIDSIKRKGWQSWTDDFAHRFPGQAIAWYLQGDAYMRNLNKDKALKCFNQAIDIDPKFAPAYDARGVLFSITEDKLDATNDFNTACSLGPGISEFFIERGTMFYDNKAPESADKDFNKALGISKNNALALNGKACAKLFDFHEINNENEFKDILYYLYIANENLNLPFFNENKHALILQIENKISPDQKETPFFRVSDFLDWNSLCQRSQTNQNDLFRIILKSPLPEIIDVETLIKINSLLAQPDIFKSFLDNKHVPDSLKSIIYKANKISVKKGIKEQECIECQNRIVFEQFYEGLISPFRKRSEGMNVNVKTNLMDIPQKYVDNAVHYWGQKDNVFKDIDVTVHGDINAGVKTKAINFRADLGVNMSAKASQVMLTTAKLADVVISPIYIYRTDRITEETKKTAIAQLNDPTHPITPVIKDRLIKGLTQGGAIANIRRQYVDNDTPYFLICINGLGYESK